MIKIGTLGLVLAVTSSVAFAQAKKAPRKRPAPAPAAEKQPEAPAAEPAPPVLPPVPLPPPAAPAPGSTAPAPLKTDEKAGTKLEKDVSSGGDVTVADQQLAGQAFRVGNEQLNNGLFPQAVAKYREALSHWDHPAIHYNLALALINLNRPIEVYDELIKAIAYGADPLEKDKFDHAKDYLKLVTGQLADVEVSCDKIGAKVTVDGKEVFIAPGKYTAKVQVGKHTFYADKEGYNATITAPFIGPGEKYRFELKLYTAEELTRYRRKWDNTWFPYAILGAGVAFGLAGGALEVSAQSSYNQFNTKVAACTTQSAGCPTGTPGVASLRDSGDTKRLLGFVGYGVAGAALVTGVTLLWLNRSQPYQITADELNRAPAVSIAPIVSPDAMGAMVQGHF